MISRHTPLRGSFLSGSVLSGFTIVELLVVIVIVGILATLTIVSYNGIAQRAITAQLSADLSSASSQLKLYQVTNSAYPTSLDCSASPASDSICLKTSSNNEYSGYSFNNSVSPQTFSLTIRNGSIYYRITENSAPVAVSGNYYRQSITVDHTKVGTGGLTNFPVLVDLSNLGSSFFSNVASDGRDIRVTTSDGVTQLAVEVVTINTGTETGEVWFKADTLSDTVDTIFYLNYGDAAATMPLATDPYGSQAVWTSYSAVYHMQNAGSGSQTDATGNGRTLVNKGSVDDTDNVTGKFAGSAIQFDGSANDGYYYNYANTIFGDPSEFTITAWIKLPTGVSNGNMLISSRDQVGGSIRWPFSGNWDGTTNKFSWDTRTQTTSTIFNPSTANFTDDTYFYTAFAWKENATTYNYTNGVSSASASQVTGDFFSGNQRLMIGWFYYDVPPNNERFEKGIVDELRIVSGTQRGAPWLMTEYNNQNDPSSFYAVGAQE